MRTRAVHLLALATWLSLALAPEVMAGPYLAATGVYSEDFGFFGNTPDNYSIGNDLASELADRRANAEKKIKELTAKESRLNAELSQTQALIQKLQK